MSEPKRPGRPALDPADHSVPVTLSLPSKLLAVLLVRADRDRVTVQAWIRRAIQAALDVNKTA